MRPLQFAQLLCKYEAKWARLCWQRQHRTSHKRNYMNRYVTGDYLTDTERHITRSWTEGTLHIDQVLYPGSEGLSAGQDITFSEPVGIYDGDDGYFYKRVILNTYELKGGNQYVLFLMPPDDRGVYEVGNLYLGHFDVTGNDPLDEIGGAFDPDGSQTTKQDLRDELTRDYGITFVPKNAPSITALSPGSAAPGGAAFTLSVTGSDFKDGAVVKFGTAEKPTTFLSATSLSVSIAASDIAAAGTVNVTVVNPDQQVSAGKPFAVGQTSALPGAQIVSHGIAAPAPGSPPLRR